MTAEELQAYREQIIAEELASGGIRRVTTGDLSVETDSARDRLDLIDRLETRTTPQPHYGLRFSKLIPPGGGG